MALRLCVFESHSTATTGCQYWQIRTTVRHSPTYRMLVWKPGLKCRGHNPTWQDQIHLLETAVLCPTSTILWTLCHEQTYIFRKLDNNLVWVNLISPSLSSGLISNVWTPLNVLDMFTSGWFMARMRAPGSFCISTRNLLTYL